jgi:hypothetical protein
MNESMTICVMLASTRFYTPTVFSTALAISCASKVFCKSSLDNLEPVSALAALSAMLGEVDAFPGQVSEAKVSSAIFKVVF